MASPDGGVYVEIIAPDFRFVFVLVLAVAWLLLARGPHRRLSAPIVLLLLTTLAFVPWLTTTGNGRYFIAFLLIAGPLCIGLLHLIPVTRSFRVLIAVGMLSWQAFLLVDTNPWRTWGHVSWTDAPAFQVDIPPGVMAEPATYVTLSNISYSLIAPRFHPASRWINIAMLPGLGDKSPDGLRAQALIATPGPLRVIFPTLPGGQEGARIDPLLGQAIDELLAVHGLSLQDDAQCRLLLSGGLAGLASARVRDAGLEKPAVHGFWLCPVARHASTRVAQARPASERAESVFRKLESVCPRIFPGPATSFQIRGGVLRGYPESDFKLYVLDDGHTWYKYIRALNPVFLGTAEKVLDPAFTMDCNNIQGRSGLPWERGI